MSGNAGNGTGTLFVDPKGENRRWDSHVVMQPPNGVVGNEETILEGHRRRRQARDHSLRSEHAALFQA